MVTIVQKGGLRENSSSTEQSRGQRMWFAIKSNILDRSMSEDKY